MKDLHIQEIDTYKYLDWLYSKTGTTKEQEINRVQKRNNEDLKLIEDNPDLTNKEKAKEQTNNRTTLLIKQIENTTYWMPPTDEDKKEINYWINAELDWRTIHLNTLLESTPLNKETILSDLLQRLIKEDFPKYNSIHKEVISGRVVQDFTELSGYIAIVRWMQYIDNEIAKEQSNQQYTTSEKTLTHPQKIILLEKLGFFKLEKFNNLTNRQKDIITSMLINEDETNTRKYINGLTSKAKAGSYNPYKNRANEDIVNNLLN